MHVALSSGTAFVADKLWENREVKGEFSDAQGWLNANGATYNAATSMATNEWTLSFAATPASGAHSLHDFSKASQHKDAQLPHGSIAMAIP